jgi:nucleotide-binding universal stress UspA family protein
MSFKSLLVPVQPQSAREDALPRVVEFAEALGAELTGVCALASAFVANPWIVSGDIIQQLTDDQEVQFKAAEARFQAACKRLGGRAHWRIHHDYPNHAVNMEAAGADLILATIDKGPEASTVGLPTLVLEAGLPIIALPAPAQPIAADTILVGWRNTADARRAVSAALPLLEKARTVMAVQIVQSQEADDAWAGLLALKNRLKLHGIMLEAELVFKEGDADSVVLLDAAGERRVDMIVLGGYGHARAREWVLGGMTHDLLASTTVPLFMVH